MFNLLDINEMLMDELAEFNDLLEEGDSEGLEYLLETVDQISEADNLTVLED